MHVHQRSHYLSAISNSLFKYNRWRLFAITWFCCLGVEVEWPLIALILLLTNVFVFICYKAESMPNS